MNFSSVHWSCLAVGFVAGFVACKMYTKSNG